MAHFTSDSDLASHIANTHKLSFEVNVDASAGTYTLDPEIAANSVAVVRYACATAAAEAIEASCCWDVGFTTPVHATGIFGIIVDASKLLADSGKTIDKVYKIVVDNLTTGTATVTPAGDNKTRGGVAEEDGVTTAGNIAFSIDSNQDLTMVDVRFRIEITYKTR